MKTVRRVTWMALLTALTVAGLAPVGRADDAADPTGTWKWTMTRNDQTREVTLKLKLEGDKLTGMISGRNNQETAIEDAKYKDGEVSFTVTREFNGQKLVVKYQGKVSGDAIKGKTMREGQTESRDWEAKREKTVKS
ncbi:MAG TPA: hypothetical protein VHC22_23605 [Pirellulales bacterium]|nr:hypothetical protein [Pirellulales bacterium]